MQRRYIALLLTQTMPDVDRLPLIFYSKARVLAVTLAVCRNNAHCLSLRWAPPKPQPYIQTLNPKP